jgi:hypothetical protein
VTRERPMTDPKPIAHVPFTDGSIRPVFEDDGRQYVIGDDGGRA